MSFEFDSSVSKAERGVILALQQAYYDLDYAIFQEDHSDDDDDDEDCMVVDVKPYLKALSGIENTLKGLGYRLKLNDLTDEWDLVKIKTRVKP